MITLVLQQQNFNGYKHEKSDASEADSHAFFFGRS
jgi:hypothetical protein